MIALYIKYTSHEKQRYKKCLGICKYSLAVNNAIADHYTIAGAKVIESVMSICHVLAVF